MLKLRNCLWLVILFALLNNCVNAAETVHDDAEIAENSPELPTIYVIGVTPLSSDTSIDNYAGNVQSLFSEEIAESHATNVSELLINNISSVSVNTAQGNAYQNDIFYRGFLASPLVGSAVGLSLYIDGIRANEGFGDTINWDLVPQLALSAINIIPGSNPLFGLNTLGGAIALQTKSGRVFQGTEIGVSGGSWGRLKSELEHGGYVDAYDWYVAANIIEEDSWRDQSSSDIQQIFSKIGWGNDLSDLTLSYLYNDNDLIGNGFVPDVLLALDREAVHTFPDNTLNELHHFTLHGEHWWNNAWQVEGSSFYRNYTRSTINGDAESECNVFVDNMGEDPVAANLCSGTVATVRTLNPGGLFDEDGNMLLDDAMPLSLEAGGEERRSLTETDSYGAMLQMTITKDIFNINNQLSFGLDYSYVDVRFTQDTAEADLQRFGNSVGTINPEPSEIEVSVETKQENIGLYFTNTVELSEATSMTLSGRWQYVDIEIRDQTGLPENADLNGNHDFFRFSPAIGLLHQAFTATTFFANYSQGFRVPTAAELTCADENDPCNLPNAFVADPPLEPVIAHTIEVGVRGELDVATSLLWNIALYRTRLQDDLLFTATETSGGGFFQNIGKTLRDGVEIGVGGQFKQMSYFANYAYVDATFDSVATLASVVDSEGVQIRPGNQIPNIPEHTFKLGAEYELLSNAWVGGNVFFSSGSFLRGDEANKLEKTDNYTIFNMNARVDISSNIGFWLRVDNVFDTKYETAGVRNFNANADIIFGTDIAEERFVAPGAPRAAWLGLTIGF